MDNGLLSALLKLVDNSYANNKDNHSWNRDKRFEFYVEASDHYGLDRDIFDKPDEESRRLIRRAELLHIPTHVIEHMQEEEALRSNPNLLTRSSALPKEVLIRDLNQYILKEMQKDMGRFIGQHRDVKGDLKVLSYQLRSLMFSIKLAYSRWRWRRGK